MRLIIGTHMGKLSPEARERRASKNARRANRVHPKLWEKSHPLDAPARGGYRWNTRLWSRGNAARRGSHYA